jgi:hypothetical protein
VPAVLRRRFSGTHAGKAALRRFRRKCGEVN